MMFSLLTRMLMTTIVRTATTKAIANEPARLGAFTVKYISNLLCSELNALCDHETSRRPSPTPTMVPSNVAASA
jgi:hypothetical protein